MGMTFPPLLLSKSPEIRKIEKTFRGEGKGGTKFSHDNAAHDKERSEDLKIGDISLQDELVEAGRHHSSEAAENDQDGWRHQKKGSEVDVVVDCVDQRRKQELEGSSDGLFI